MSTLRSGDLNRSNDAPFRPGQLAHARAGRDLRFSDMQAVMKAAGEATRLRILALLCQAELTVTELTDVLRQSQPRISRHLKLLMEAGLIERYREGSWAFFRFSETEGGPTAIRDLVARLDPHDAVIARDSERLADVRQARAAVAQSYFRRHAAEWDRIRKLHVADESVEAALHAIIGDGPIGSMLDLGTGTGRMLEVFAPQIDRGLGLDFSLDMLAVARERLDRAGLRHCSVRQGDIYDLASVRDRFDLVVIHQVLHFLDDGARALREAARVLRPGGKLLVVDFAPHDMTFLQDEHAHRRLGFTPETVMQWLVEAGLDPVSQRTLAPDQGSDGKIAVSIWCARDPRMQMAQPSRTASQEVA